MLKSNLCKYSDAYILVSGTITVVGAGAENTARAAARVADRNNKQAIFENCASFVDCTTETNNTQVDNAKYLDVVMSMYNLIEYSNNYSKTYGSLYQFCIHEPNNNITDSESFKFKFKFLDNTNNEGIMMQK